MSRPPCSPMCLGMACGWAVRGPWGGTCKETPQKPWDAQSRAAPAGWQHPVLCLAMPYPDTAQPCTRAKQQVGALGLVPVGDFRGQESHRKSLNLQILTAWAHSLWEPRRGTMGGNGTSPQPPLVVASSGVPRPWAH